MKSLPLVKCAGRDRLLSFRCYSTMRLSHRASLCGTRWLGARWCYQHQRVPLLEAYHDDNLSARHFVGGRCAERPRNSIECNPSLRFLRIESSNSASPKKLAKKTWQQRLVLAELEWGSSSRANDGPAWPRFLRFLRP